MKLVEPPNLLTLVNKGRYIMTRKSTKYADLDNEVSEVESPTPSETFGICSNCGLGQPSVRSECFNCGCDVTN